MSNCTEPEPDAVIEQTKNATIEQLTREIKELKAENEIIKKYGGFEKGVKPIATNPKNTE